MHAQCQDRLERILRQTTLIEGPFNRPLSAPTLQLSHVSNTNRGVCLVVGAGDGLGAAITKKFSREGFHTVICRRNIEKAQPLISEIEQTGGKITAYKCDARKEEEVIQLVDNIEKELGELQVVIFNIGANVPESILKETARKYYKIWEMATFSGFLVGREAAKRMAPRARGSIIFSGATASIRGKSHFAAFSGAKAALRSLAQSMAKELGPMGVHVAHIVIDGAINANNDLQNEELLQADKIADNYFMISQQPKSCWTFELDLRSHIENW